MQLREDDEGHGNRWYGAYNRGFSAGQVAAEKLADEKRERTLLNWLRAAAVIFLIVTLYVYGPKPEGATEESAIAVVGAGGYLLLALIAIMWLGTEVHRVLRQRKSR